MTRTGHRDDVAGALARRTLELVDVPSESRREDAIARVVADAVVTPATPLRHRDDSSLFVAHERGERPLVVLAGHLDTVPAQDNVPGRVDGGRVHGLGASDMKGGLAVMVELARAVADGRIRPAVDVGFLFFGREELPATESALPALFDSCADVLRADLVVVMEPTANALQLGCLGNLNADVTFAGRSAHSARPWLGTNAIHRAVTGLQALAATPPRDVEVGGLTFVEVVNVTGIEGGIARNVIPDAVRCRVNFRYAPNRSPADAEAALRALLPDHALLTVAGNAPPALPATGNALVDRLRRAARARVQPKQAWTPVAEFAARGLDAVNFGPGDPRLAHRPDESVEIAALEASFAALARFVSAD
ncbi:MAG TPA: succinyl-diaminopimelate desuccinylase [Actinomycetota bacterium]|nr:succinyl-diaminopimelate desuccinylase [Actinomycetota bacterium]